MRDVLDFTQQQTYWKVNTRLNSTSTVVVNRQKTRTQRDDIVKTQWNLAHKYYKPTAYKCFFAYTGAKKSDGSWQVGINTYYGEVDGWQDRGYFRYGCSVQLLPIIPLEVQSRADNMAINQIHEDRMDYGQFLVEMRESYAGVVDILKEVRSLLSLATRGNLGAFRQYMTVAAGTARLPVWATGRRQTIGDLMTMRTTRSLAKRYNQYMWGVRPLMGDLFGLLEKIEFNLSQGRFKASGHGADGAFTLDGIEPSNRSTRWASGQCERGNKVEVCYKIDDPFLFTVAGYGLTNPLALAWELVPYSFVIDWFLHVGNFLRACEGQKGTNFEWGYRTSYVTNRFTYCERLSPDPGGTTIVYKPLIAECPIDTFAMNRELLPGFPTPSPYIDLGINAEQGLHIIALIAGR